MEFLASGRPSEPSSIRFAQIVAEHVRDTSSAHALKVALRSTFAEEEYPSKAEAVGMMLMMLGYSASPDAYYFRLKLKMKGFKNHFYGCLAAVDFANHHIILYHVQFKDSAGIFQGRVVLHASWADIVDLEAAPIPASAMNDHCLPVRLEDFLAYHNIKPARKTEEMCAVVASILQLRPFYPYTATSLAMEICNYLLHNRGINRRTFQRTTKHRLLLPFLPSDFQNNQHIDIDTNKTFVLFPSPDQNKPRIKKRLIQSARAEGSPGASEDSGSESSSSVNY